MTNNSDRLIVLQMCNKKHDRINNESNQQQKNAANNKKLYSHKKKSIFLEGRTQERQDVSIFNPPILSNTTNVI